MDYSSIIAVGDDCLASQIARDSRKKISTPFDFTKSPSIMSMTELWHLDPFIKHMLANNLDYYSSDDKGATYQIITGALYHGIDFKHQDFTNFKVYKKILRRALDFDKLAHTGGIPKDCIYLCSIKKEYNETIQNFIKFIEESGIDGERMIVVSNYEDEALSSYFGKNYICSEKYSIDNYIMKKFSSEEILRIIGGV